ncbi:FecR family protein [Chryseobacterium gallinarum]|uniref:FecR family protein n=1 Tax=Chryseobacterium gallinarum TaxID=1324352 RepID=UPI0006A74B03|nr:FecR family protein [Chryseobacterium gallinarum]
MEEQQFFDELTIVPLLSKLVQGEELSTLESKAVEIWINKNAHNRAVFEELQNQQQVAQNLVNFDIAQSKTEDNLHMLHTMLNMHRSASHWKRWLVAAAILLAVSISVMLYLDFRINNSKPTVTASSSAEDILPGKDQATLTFDDGKTIELTHQAVTVKGDAVLYADGTKVASNTMKYATLSTPRKGQYKITLADGTRVWLNAESSLKYPAQFPQDKRLVELTGEGYFEVEHDKTRPFIVITGGQEVKVLGTRFNINAYNNEPYILTTLVEGSVQLSDVAHKTTLLLKPSQQAIYTSGRFDVNTLDTEPYTAWTENEFSFRSASMGEVLRQLERWYDIEVDYSTMATGLEVSASLKRDKKLSSVLQILEKATDIQFEMKGRRLRIRE